MSVGGIFIVGFMLLFVGVVATCSLYAALTAQAQSRRIGVI